MEDIEKNVRIIEEEKQEYLKEHPEESSEEAESEEEPEEVDAEQTEFSLSEDEIGEWMSGLARLKEMKGSIELEINPENVLKVNYEEDSDEFSEGNIEE